MANETETASVETLTAIVANDATNTETDANGNAKGTRAYNRKNARGKSPNMYVSKWRAGALDEVITYFLGESADKLPIHEGSLRAIRSDLRALFPEIDLSAGE